MRILFWFLLTRLRELHVWSTVNDVAVGVIQRENHIVNMPMIHSFPSQRCWMWGLTQRIQSKVKVTVWILPVLMTIYSESPEGIISKKSGFYSAYSLYEFVLSLNVVKSCRDPVLLERVFAQYIYILSPHSHWRLNL